MIKLFDEIPLIEGNGILLREVRQSDIASLNELVSNDRVYRYLPTFLYEKSSEDLTEIISGMYEDLFTSKESLILAICRDNGEMAGLAEFYGYKDDIHKVSIGYRLLERYWGMGIASSAVESMVDYLYSGTDIEIITASTMIQNRASGRVLEKKDFSLVVSSVGEDWGYPEPTLANKWIR